MVEVFENLFVGDDGDYRNLEKEYDPLAVCDQPVDGWAVVHACRDPYHRQLLGYTTRGAPKDDPEYYYAVRGNRLFMNIVNAPKAIFFDPDLIDVALLFITKKINDGFKVLVQCNEGKNRAPSLALLYGLQEGLLSCDELEDCEAEMLGLYPDYEPGKGMREFVAENHERYREWV